jgi:pre-rRNA-processing protein IPI3
VYHLPTTIAVMLTETLLLATTRTPTDNVDAPSISLYNLHTSTLTTSLKRSQTSSSGLAITKTHIFAQQSDKPVINIYSLSTSLLETSISFPEPFTVLSASPCGLYLAAGTATGRVYIWELASARFVATPPLHLQKITALAWNRTGAILAVGSEDTNVSIWSVAALLDTRQAAREPLRVLDRHIHAVTALAIGPAGSGPSELLVTAGRDKNVICWELHTGTHLRTYMIQGVPLCLAMDPAERAVYTGLEEGGVQMVEFQATQSGKSDMYEGEFRDMPVQVTREVWGGGAKVLTAQVGYEGNVLVTGDEKGECAVWDVASGGMVKSLCQMKGMILPSPLDFSDFVGDCGHLY